MGIYAICAAVQGPLVAVMLNAFDVEFGLPISITVALVALIFVGGAIRAAVGAGVTVEPKSIHIQGFFRSATVPRSEIAALEIMEDGAGEPSGWLRLRDSRMVLLRGMSVRHRHGYPFSGCETCEEDRAGLRDLAEAASLPVEEGRRRRGSIRNL